MSNKKDRKDEIKSPHNRAEDIETEQNPKPKEIGGRAGGLEPTRYGDWEKNGRCIDF